MKLNMFAVMVTACVMFSGCGSETFPPVDQGLVACSATNPCPSGQACTNGQCVASNPDGGNGGTNTGNLCDGLLHMKPNKDVVIKCFEQFHYAYQNAQLKLSAGEWGVCPAGSGSFLTDDHSVTGIYFGGFSNCVSREWHTLVGPSASPGAFGGQLPTYPGDGSLVNGAQCGSDADCHSNHCDRICVSGNTTPDGGNQLPATCNDGQKNGDETDVDCGGSCNTLNKCADGKGCSVAADCVSGSCNGGICGSGSQPCTGSSCGGGSFTAFSQSCTSAVHIEFFDKDGRMTRALNAGAGQEIASNPGANEVTSVVQNYNCNNCTCKWIENGSSMSGPSSNAKTPGGAQCFWNGPPKN